MMFTYSFTEPGTSLGAALPSTLLHAAVVAGAMWASGVAVAPADDPIDVVIAWPVRTTTHHTTTTTSPLPGIPIIGIPTIPDLPDPGPIPTLPGTPLDPRQFATDTIPGTTTIPGGDPGSSVGIFRDTEVDDLPTLVTSGRLRYPTVLAEAGMEGSVTLGYVIDVEGRVEGEGIEVVSATHAGFVPAAKEAVATSRFRPAKKGGYPVRVRVRQTVTFRR